jgi:hypothetical protein
VRSDDSTYVLPPLCVIYYMSGGGIQDYGPKGAKLYVYKIIVVVKSDVVK